MSTMQYSTKLTSEQIEALRRISDQTHIPQAVLIREAVDILIEELGKKTVSLDFLKMVKEKIREDKTVLKQLAGRAEL